ncbi:hypothetical protein RUND412_001262 [Rhizina undulata]
MPSSENLQNLPPATATTPSWLLKQLPLASLSPEASTSEPAYLLVVATLLWPFSPSSSSLSFLACEQDFRLRLSKGQLRVNLQGPAAHELASKKLQIGDEVMISLEGAVFEELENPTARDVPWSIAFSKRLVMKIKNNSGWSTIDIDSPETLETIPSPSPSDGVVIPERETPPRPSYGFLQDENSWSTPGAFKRRTTFLSQESSSPFGLHMLFDEKDLDLERQRKRPRFSSSFRLVDDMDNPDKIGEGDKGMELGETYDGVHKDQEMVSHDDPPKESESTFSKDRDESETLKKIIESAELDFIMPAPRLWPLKTNMRYEEFSPEVPDSPSLDPVPSPQLPLVSPFLGHGLSSTDYLSVNFALSAHELPRADQIFQKRKEKEKGFPFTSAFKTPGVSRNPEMPPPTQEDASTTVQVTSPEGRLTPGSFNSKKLGATKTGETYVSDDEKPSDGESERDSLFDELSDVEGVRRRARSISPLSSLRNPIGTEKTLPLKSLAKPSKPSKLSITTTPSRVREDREGPLQTPQSARHPKTPFLYLPTPSPKTERLLKIPQSSPPKFALQLDRNTSPVRGSGLFWSDDIESTPHAIFDYFGRPIPQKPQATSGQSSSKSLTHGDVESSNAGESDVAESNAAERDAAESDAAEGDAAESDSWESDTTESDAAESYAAESDAAESDAAESYAAESDAAESDAAESDAAESDAAESYAAENDTAKTDTAKTDAAENDTAENDTAENYTAENDTTKNDAAKNDAAENDTAKNDAAENDTAAKDAAENESAPSSLTARKERDDLDEFSSNELEVGLITNLSNFPPLSLLKWGAVVDMIGIVVHRVDTKRAKSGKKDYYMSMKIADPSRPIGVLTTVFRPYKEALPAVSVGDVVLLRSFKVWALPQEKRKKTIVSVHADGIQICSQQHSLCGVSTPTSAWAVWRDMGRVRPASIPGPPVEFGESEEKYVRELGNWYEKLDETTRERLERGLPPFPEEKLATSDDQ